MGNCHQDEYKTGSVGEISITEGSHTHNILLLLPKQKDLNIKNPSSPASATTNPISNHGRIGSRNLDDKFPH